MHVLVFRLQAVFSLARLTPFSRVRSSREERGLAFQTAADNRTNVSRANVFREKIFKPSL